MSIDLLSSTFAQSSNTITDGQLTCSYNELPSLFNQIDDDFASVGLTPNDCLAFECPNSVPGAITLLYLLERGYGLILLPPAGHATKGEAFKASIPDFCHYHLTIQNGCPVPEAIQLKQLETIGTFTFPAKRLSVRTSGSLGSSKIVVHRHDKLLLNAHNCLKKYQFETIDRVFIPVPIFHMYGLGAAFLPAILAGASIQLVDNANILKILQYEKKFQPNIAFLTPHLCRMLLRIKREPGRYKVIVTSGQAIQETVFRKFDEQFGGCLVNQYGSTEMGAIAACTLQDSLENRAMTIGSPMEGVSLRLKTSPDSHIGELFCQHPYGYEGYMDDDGTWLVQADEAEWYSTGDLAKIEANDYIKVIGRSDDSLNRRGFLVLLSEVAQTIEQLETVEKAILLHLKPTDKLVAVCLATISGAEIRDACFDILPHYALPDMVTVVKAFPMLPSGKIDRQSLITFLEEILL